MTFTTSPIFIHHYNLHYTSFITYFTMKFTTCPIFIHHYNLHYTSIITYFIMTLTTPPIFIHHYSVHYTSYIMYYTMTFTTSPIFIHLYYILLHYASTYLYLPTLYLFYYEFPNDIHYVSYMCPSLKPTIQILYYDIHYTSCIKSFIHYIPHIS